MNDLRSSPRWCMDPGIMFSLLKSWLNVAVLAASATCARGHQIQTNAYPSFDRMTQPEEGS